MRRRRWTWSWAFVLGATSCNQLLGNDTASSVLPEDAAAAGDAGAFAGDASGLEADGPPCPACPGIGTELVKLTDPRALVADPVRGVYWTTGSPGTVSHLGSGNSVIVDLMNLVDPFGVALDLLNGDVYYTLMAGRVVTKINGTALALDNGSTHVGQPLFLAVLGSYVVFTDATSPQVLSQTWAGGNNLSGTTLAPGSKPWAITASTGRAFFTVLGTCGDMSDGAVQSIAVPAGAAATTLVPAAACPTSIAADGSDVYFTERAIGSTPSSGAVKKVAFSGGPTATVASAQPKPSAVAVDGADVFWTNEGDLPGEGTVMRASIAGGTPQVLAVKQKKPVGIAVAGRRLYWITAGVPAGPDSGALMAMDIP